MKNGLAIGNSERMFANCLFIGTVKELQRLKFARTFAAAILAARCTRQKGKIPASCQFFLFDAA